MNDRIKLLNISINNKTIHNNTKDNLKTIKGILKHYLKFTYIQLKDRHDITLEIEQLKISPFQTKFEKKTGPESVKKTCLFSQYNWRNNIFFILLNLYYKKERNKSVDELLDILNNDHDPAVYTSDMGKINEINENMVNNYQHINKIIDKYMEGGKRKPGHNNNNHNNHNPQHEERSAKMVGLTMAAANSQPL